MARTKKSKPGRARKEAAAAAASAPAAGPSAPVDVAGLIDKAHTLLAQSNFELAIKFLTRAVEHEPNNLEAREVLGVAELEGGDEDAGREHLLRLFPPHTDVPPPHPSPYLYLAQTAGDPHEALGYYSTAAAMIENAFASADGGSASAGEYDGGEGEMRAMGVRALVAMIEIWMSDLCMEPEAENNCSALIDRAVTMAPTDSEVQLTLASIRMSQSRVEEAKQVVEGVYERLREMDAFSPLLPPLPTRLNLSRQLLEHNLHLPALDILLTAREEDSLEVESAYLEGWAYYMRAKSLEEAPASGTNGSTATSGEAAKMEGADADEDKDLEELSAAECLSESFRALIECAQLFEDQEYPDEGIGGHVGELLDELKERGIVPAIVEAGAEDSEAAEGWEDVEME